MDDAVPRLIGLLLAGAVAMLALRSQLGDSPQGQRLYRLVLVVFLLVIGFAVWALLRQGGAGPARDPDAPTTVAALRRPAASAGERLAYVDKMAAESHNHRPLIGAAPAA